MKSFNASPEINGSIGLPLEGPAGLSLECDNNQKNNDVELVCENIENDITNINWIVNKYFTPNNIKELSNKKLLSHQIYVTNYFLKNCIDMNTDKFMIFFKKCIAWLCNTSLFQLMSYNQQVLRHRKPSANNFPRSFYKLCTYKENSENKSHNIKECMDDHIPYNKINIDINCVHFCINTKMYLNIDEIIKTLKTINYVFKYISNNNH